MIDASLGLLVLAGIWAGAQNALAGGGSFITLPALMAAGLDARVANLTSTVALFPGQITTALANRRLVSGIGPLGFPLLLAISLGGGVVGALLLLATPSNLFRAMLPWLVLAATLLFARGAFGRKVEAAGLGGGPLGLGQFGVAIYGGYFGGGIGFLMMAALTLAGLSARQAAANKNILAAVMNLAAVLVFVFSPNIAWLHAAILSVGAIIGSLLGALALKRVNDRILRIAIVGIGIALTIGLFLKPL